MQQFAVRIVLSRVISFIYSQLVGCRILCHLLFAVAMQFFYVYALTEFCLSEVYENLLGLSGKLMW